MLFSYKNYFGKKTRNKRKLKRISNKAEEHLKISKTTQSRDFCHSGLIMRIGLH